MSRTVRNYATWVDWTDDFDLTLKRGHCPVPIHRARRDGGLYHDEVWRPTGKRWNKRFRSKAIRRQGKRLLEEINYE